MLFQNIYNIAEECPEHTYISLEHIQLLLTVFSFVWDTG